MKASISLRRRRETQWTRGAETLIDFNTNLDALSALHNLNNINSQITIANQRLTTGKRINSAADDPSGYVAANALQFQVDGINQAVQNTQTSINLIKTATGGLSQISTLVSAIRSAAQDAAANIATNPTQAAADQLVITNAITSINNIANTTQYGNKFLLNGQAGVSVSVTDSARVAGLSLNAFGNVTPVGSGITLSVTTAATQAVVTGTVSYASATALISSGGAATGGTININGQNITVLGTDTVQTVLNNINVLSATTGVVAGLSGGKIVLTQNTTGSNYSVNLTSSASIIGAAGTQTAFGTNATATITFDISIGTITNNYSGGQQSGDSGLTLRDGNGNILTLNNAGNSAGFSGQIGVITATPTTFQIGPNSGNTVTQNLPNAQAQNLGTTSVPGSSLNSVDVTSSAGAANAVAIATEAYNQISKYSAQLGSFQTNVLQATNNVLQNTVTDLTASITAITGADTAAEATRLTQLQTIQQAGISVLKSAISTPSLYLKLLS